jgi:hypothetical protein
MTRRYESSLQIYFNNRRCRQDRRKFSYAIHIPERRTGANRRSVKDRRSNLERRKTFWQILDKPEDDLVKSER